MGSYLLMNNENYFLKNWGFILFLILASCSNLIELNAQAHTKFFSDSTIMRKELNVAGYSKKEIRKITDKGIKSISDLIEDRDVIRNLVQKGLDFEIIKKSFIAHALTSNTTLINSLQQRKFRSIFDLDQLSINEIVSLSGDELSSEEAKLVKYNIADYGEYLKVTKTRKAIENRNFGLYDLSGIIQRGTGNNIGNPVYFQPDSDCQECEDSNSLLSPGVYVLYLLDFISKVFPDDFIFLDSINYRFHHRMEDVPVQSDIWKSGSYVMYANEILENYLAELLEPEEDPYEVWPNRLGTNDLRDSLEIRKQSMYELFSSDPGCPYPNIIEELFDSYVNEFGTTRRDVRIARLGDSTYQKKISSS